MHTANTHYERDLSINEACSILNVTNPTVYKLIARGQLDSYKVGRSRRITRESLQRLRQGHPKQPG
jgi:excisionase family DNA binding protein